MFALFPNQPIFIQSAIWYSVFIWLSNESFLIDLSSIIFHRLSLQLNFAQPGSTEIATCLSQSLPELLSQAAGNQDILPLPAVNFYFLPTLHYTTLGWSHILQVHYSIGQNVWQPDFVRGIGSLEPLTVQDYVISS